MENNTIKYSGSDEYLFSELLRLTGEEWTRLFDDAWNSRSYKDELIRILITLSISGNNQAKQRLVILFNRTKTTSDHQDDDLLEYSERWPEIYVDALLCSCSKEDWEWAREICKEHYPEKWACKYLIQFEHSGIWESPCKKTIRKLMPKADYLFRNPNIARGVQSEIFDKETVIIHGKKIQDIDFLICICFQNNLFIDVIWAEDCNYCNPLFNVVKEIDNELKNDYALISMEKTIVEEHPVLSLDNIYLIDNQELYSSTGFKSLFTVNPLLPASKNIIITDMKEDAISNYINSFYKGAEVTHSDHTCKDGHHYIIISQSILFTKEIYQKNPKKYYVDPFFINKTLSCLMYKRPNTLYVMKLSKMFLRLLSGKTIYDELKTRPDTFYVSYGAAMGDHYMVSRREDTDYSNKYIIINGKGEGLSKTFGIRCLELSSKDRRDLATYISFDVSNGRDNVWLTGDSPHYPGFESIKQTFSLITGVPRLTGTNYLQSSAITNRFPIQVKGKDYFSLHVKSILLSPYSKTTSKRYPNLRKVYLKLFNKIAQSLIKQGYRVYTNVLDSENELPGTKRLSISMHDLMINSSTFDFIISSYSGLIDSMMLTDVNLINIIPAKMKPQRVNYSALCRHTNYWEMNINEKNINENLKEILFLVNNNNAKSYSPREYYYCDNKDPIESLDLTCKKV